VRPAGPEALTPTEHAVAHTLARGAVYRLLGAAFAYPLAWRFQELAHAAGMAGDAPTTPEALRAPLARFADAARNADPAAVAAEYVFLFDRQVRCPPYEGAYGAARGLAGKAAQLADIAGFYTAFGLSATATQPDMEDHIAAELEFLSALALKEAYARGEEHAEGLAVTRAAEAAFLRDHLGGWAEAFAAGVQAATPLPFYVTAAELLAAWVRAEVDALGVQPAWVAGPDAPAEDETFTCPMAPADEPLEPAAGGGGVP
jgi:TorA maturation chaperone TorD